MKIRAFLILSALLLFTLPAAATPPPVNYNKPFAIFMSVISPGMGQLYSGQPDKGLAIWTASAALSAGFLLTVADIHLNSTGGPFPFNIGLQFKPSLTQSEVFWAVGLGVTFLSVYVYNILDVSFYSPLRDVKLSLAERNISLSYDLAF